jgi:hypothetical protein
MLKSKRTGTLKGQLPKAILEAASRLAIVGKEEMSQQELLENFFRKNVAPSPWVMGCLFIDLCGHTGNRNVISVCANCMSIGYRKNFPDGHLLMTFQEFFSRIRKTGVRMPARKIF